MCARLEREMCARLEREESEVLIHCYRVAKRHEMPYLHRSFSANELSN